MIPATADEQPELIEMPSGTAVVYCARSPRKTTPNEDGAAVIIVDDTRAVLAVADGMGGQPAGDQASRLALDAIGERARAVARGGKSSGGDGDEADTLPKAILHGFEDADDDVKAKTPGAGTTLALAMIDGPAMRPYHVGDSVILVFGQRGPMRLETVAHSPVGYAVEAGLLSADDAMHHIDRHLVSNFIGAPDMRIEIGDALALRPGDTVLLGSDGLFDNLHTQEIVDIARTGTLTEVAEELVAACRQRMLAPEAGHPSKADDLTFIVYRPGERD